DAYTRTRNWQGFRIVKEEWRDVVGFERLYKVSNKGRVYSLPRVTTNRNGLIHRKGHMMSVVPIGKEDLHLHVHLRKDGKSGGYLVHRLVLEAFVGPCPPGME